MKVLINIGSYFLMLQKVFGKFTKWSVLRTLIFKDIEVLIIGSLGIVSIISFFVGGVVAIQTALNLSNPLIPRNLIGYATRQSVILEFAPTFMSIIMAGKVGSYITSSIGTMRVTEQIDALESLSFDPIGFLIFPRIFAAVVIFPVLIIIGDFFGILGGMGAAVYAIEDVSAQEFIRGLKEWFRPWDAIFGLIKGVFFGFTITSIACYKGFFISGGAEQVGKATTSTVVVSCVAIVFLDYLLAAILL